MARKHKGDEVLEYIKPSGREIVSPEDGFRALIASTLQLALREAPKNGCNGHSALRFINSEWCRELCEGIDVDYPSYVQGVVRASDGKLADE